MVHDGHAHVDWWPLGVVEQVITSSDGLVRTVKLRTGMLTCDNHCMSFLEVEHWVDDTAVFESGR